MTELGGLAGGLAVEPAARVGGAFMGVVGAGLTAEIHLAVAARPRRRGRFVLAPEALHRGAGLDEGAIHTEVLAAGQTLAPGLPQHLRKQLVHDLRIEQPLAVLGEHRRYPDRLVDRQPNEPAEQQIVVNLLPADAVEHLQQRGADELLRRDGRTSELRVGRI